MSSSSEIARKLLQIKAIKLSPQTPFTWASGMKSPIYCDNRITLSYPEIRSSIKETFAALCSKYPEATCIAGVATAGIAHGALLAEELGLPYVYVRSKPKAHGRQNLIEGELPENARVIVVEDLISTGGSSIKAVEALRKSGAEVITVVAIFTYNFPKAKENFTAASCPYETLSDYDTLLVEAENINYITKEQKELLKNWKENPKKWAIENEFNNLQS